VERLRIFVGNMPRLLRDIVEEIVRSQPDMEITGQHEKGEFVVQPNQADVVVLGERGDGKLRIATVANNERGTNLVESRRLSTEELSPQILVEAIRHAAGRTR
jgi:hypothetical protein